MTEMCKHIKMCGKFTQVREMLEISAFFSAVQWRISSDVSVNNFASLGYNSELSK